MSEPPARPGRVLRALRPGGLHPRRLPVRPSTLVLSAVFVLSPGGTSRANVVSTGGVGVSVTFTYAVSRRITFPARSVAITITPVAGATPVSSPSGVIVTLPVSLKLNVAGGSPAIAPPCGLMGVTVSWMVFQGAVVESAMAWWSSTAAAYTSLPLLGSTTGT